MRHNDGTLWHTTEHRTHAEYHSVIKDLVLESDYLGHPNLKHWYQQT
jgi:catechol O-methyltransferase